MRYKLRLVFGMWIGLFLALTAVAQDKSTPASEPDEKTIVRIQKLLDEIEIETKDFKDEMPLAKFFAALEAKFPRNKKLTVRIDKSALGDDFARISDTGVQLVHGRGNEKTSLHSVLTRVLRQLPKGVEVDYGFRGDGIVLTRPMLATHRTVYDIRDIVAYMPFVRMEGGFPAGIFQGQAETDDAAAFVRLATNALEVRPWEIIEVLNRTRLEFSASPARHESMRDLLSAIRRISECWVVTNARLYEVDRTFYAKEIAPLFATSKQGEPAAPIRLIGPELFKQITRQKMLLESEEVKIHPRQSAVFLSRQSGVQYATDKPLLARKWPGDLPQNPKTTVTGSDLAGVSFEVVARISPDRRYIQARVTQNVSQLIGIEKTKKLDPSTGKETAIESPNLRKSTVTGTVKLPDGNPILMPVDYRPSDKGKEDKVWLMVARPFIWLEEEVKERREGGKEFNQKTVWDSAIEDDKEEPPARLLPIDLETQQILQAIIKDVLTNPKLQDARPFYGTAKDKTFALVDTGNLGWSKDFKPATHGFKLVRVDPFDHPRRVLGIRIDKFDLQQKENDFMDTPIEICLFNAGGWANGGVMGGCTLYYIPKRVGMDWKVECSAWESK
jgi:hypothetical protein